MSSRLRGDSLLFNILMGGTVVLVFFLYLWSTPCLDDLRFRLVGELGSVSWSDCVETYKAYGKLFIHDANRLSNYLGPAVLTIVPRWLFGLFASVLVWILVNLCRDIIGVRGSLLGSTLLLFLFITIFPWQEQMVSRMFMLNYLFGSAIILLFIKMFVSSKPDHNGRLERIGMVFLGVLAGAVHEGLALPVLCGCVVVFIFPGNKMSRRRWYLLAGLILGLLTIFLSPAIHTRTRSYGVADINALIIVVLRYFYYVAPFTLLCIAFSMALLMRRFRLSLNRKRRELFTFLFISGLSTIGFCYIPLGLRVHTMAYWAAILGWPMFLMTFIKAYGEPSKILVRIVCALCGLFILLQLGGSFYYQRLLYNDFNRTYESAKNGASVCYIKYPIGYPLFFLHHSSAGGTLAGEYFLKHFAEHVSDISDKATCDLTILPDVLNGFKIDRASPISKSPSFYQYEGLVISTDSIDKQISRVDVFDKHGHQTVIKVYVLHMKTPDNQVYSVLVPAYFCYINKNFPEEIAEIKLSDF